MLLVPGHGRQRKADFPVEGQPGLPSESRTTRATEKPCLAKKTNKHNQPNKQINKTSHEQRNTVNNLYYVNLKIIEEKLVKMTICPLTWDIRDNIHS